MEGLLRRRDLPSVCRQPIKDPLLQLFIEKSKTMTRASGLILNTFDDLKGPILCHIAPLFPNTYTIGPLNALVKTRIGDDVVSQCLSSSSNLLESDHNCMALLNSWPLRSVVYVSFGSMVRVTRGQLLEFWYGIVNSGASFLWVIRHDMIEGVKGNVMILMELEEATKERGFVVDWGPQENVLAHPAVGGFFTHSGWNSVLESVDARVPMICWPVFGDHQLNSRWVSERWRIGLDMKDMCDRSTIEMMIKTVMKHRREEIMGSMDRFSKLAHDSVSPSGSSYSNLEKLVEDLKKI